MNGRSTSGKAAGAAVLFKKGADNKSINLTPKLRGRLFQALRAVQRNSIEYTKFPAD